MEKQMSSFKEHSENSFNIDVTGTAGSWSLIIQKSVLFLKVKKAVETLIKETEREIP